MCVTFFVAIAKVVAAAKEMAVASRYGVGEIVDAYQIATTWMLWLPTTLCSALSVVLIPKLVELKASPAEQHEFLSELQGIALLVGSFLGVMALILMPFLLPVVAGELSMKTQEFVRSFGVGMIIPVALSLLIMVHSARLMAFHHQWNTLLEGMPALMILGFVMLWPKSGLVAPLLLATLFGYILQTILLSRLACHQAGGKLGFRFSVKSREWSAMVHMLGMMVFAQFLMSWVVPMDVATATHLGDGAVAQLSYSEKVLSILLSLGALAISRAILPVFSVMAEAKDWHRLTLFAIQWGIFMALIGFMLATVAYMVAPWVIRLLFERGAFTPENTIVVTDIFRWGLTRLPFYFSGLVFFQLVASQRMFASIALIALTSVIIKYFLNHYFSIRFGMPGINLATGIMYAWSMLCLALTGILGIRNRHS